MLSPSQGFCYCLPVRLGALVVSFLACLGSAILAGITFQSLAKISERITSLQTAGFYLTSLSWLSLALFSFIGFVSVILQHPLLLTIFARFVIYHLPANLLCNLFFTVVLFNFYVDADTISRTPQCRGGNLNSTYCTASVYLEILTWAYLWIILPAVIAQAYIYVIIRRFIFVISGEWEVEKEHALEVQQRNEGKPAKKRRATITHSIGHGGRRRAKAELWFTMETPAIEEDQSFLPSMVISPMAFQSPPRSPFTSRALPASPRPLNTLPMAENPPRKSSLRPPPIPEKGGASDRSARLDMDFSDPDRTTRLIQSAKAADPVQSQQESLKGKGKSRESDSSVYSVESVHPPRPMD